MTAPRSAYRNFFHHLHPLRVRLDSLRPAATFGLGLIAVALLIILVATGILLMFYYVPSTDPVAGAYASMQDLRYAVPFGPLVRNMHRWAGHALVGVVVLHMARVFLRGAFQKPRRLNWLLGVALLVLTLGESFTGYLLPWDQLAYWAVVVGGNLAASAPLVGEPLRDMLLGGSEVTQTTLVRFYTLHVVVLPLAMIFVLAVHLWRVRVDGGLAHRSENPSEPRSVSPPPTVPSWPGVVIREAVIFLACLAAVTLAGILFSAPLGPPANPSHAPEPAKATWYFLWVQELVSYDYGPVTRLHWPPWDAAGPTLGAEFWGGVLLPTILLALLAAAPFLRRRRSDVCGVGVYCARGRRVACAVFAAILLAILVLTLVGYFLRGPNWTFVWGS